MPTAARYKALAWFFDHEALGPDAVFHRKPPSGRMRKLMERAEQVERVPVGQFRYAHWKLTAQGREALESKPKPRGRRRSLPRLRKGQEADA